MERFAGRYALVRPLGHGGMGHVWLALDLSTGRECALKHLDLRLPHAEQDGLRREFEVLARLRHPAIVGVHELGFASDGSLFYTMDHVPGLRADAALVLAGWPAFYEVAARVSEGLEALHAAGIVHGDIKPSNLLVIPGGAPGAAPAGLRLVDFGLAALLERDRAGHRGTAGYAAPEVVHGSPLSVASDLYSLGATLYVLARTVAQGQDAEPAVRPPHDGEQAALALRDHGVPEALTQLIVHLLSALPEARPTGAADVSRVIDAIAPHSRRALTDRLDSEQVVGRGHELAQLERWLVAGVDREPLMLLTGEPGVGKSTLLRELTVRAQLAGRPVILLACADGGAPGAVARTLLLRLAAAAEAVLGAGLSHAELRASLERGEAPTEFDAAADAGLAWSAAVHEHGSPVLVLLDDIDQLDGPSDTIVKRMVSGGSQGRWVWASASPRMHAEHEVWRAAGLAETMALGPLSAAGLEELVATRLRSSVPVDLPQVLWERCGGHPGLAVEVLRIAARAGVLRDSGSGVMLDRSGFTQLGLPGDFEAACRRRLAELPAAAAAAAVALAVWAEPVPATEVVALDARADAAALEHLSRAGLVVRDEADRYSFQTPAFARAVLADAEPATSEALHRRALDRPGLSPQQRFRFLRGAHEPVLALEAAGVALESAPDLRLAADAAALADTWVPARSAEWAVRAAQVHLDRGRYREARPLLERALARAPRDPRAEYWKYMLSGTLLRMGELSALGELLDAVLAQALPDAMRALFLLNHSAWLTARGRVDEGLRENEHALVLAESTGDPEAIGLALFARATVSTWLARDLERGVGDAVRAAHELRRANREGLRLRAVAAQVMLLSALDRDAEAEGVARAALAEASALGSRLAELELLAALAVVQSELGRWQESRKLDQQALRLALEEGLIAQATRCMLNVDMWGALTGDHRGALRSARRTLPAVREHLRYMEGTIRRVIGTAYRNLGQPRAARRWLQAAARVAERDRAEYERRWTAFELGGLFARHGRWRQAEEAWRFGWELQPEAQSATACLLLLGLGRAALRVGERADAEGFREQASGWLSSRRSVYGHAHLLLLDAELALARSEPVLALPLVNQALAHFGQLPAPADRAWAAVECSRLATQRGLDGQLPVDVWLRGAAADYERCGDHRGREQALTMVVDWYRRHARTRERGERERDLLQAVGRLLDSMSDFEQLTTEAMRLAVEQLDAERGVLLLSGAEGGEGGGDAADTLHPVVEFGAVDAATRDHALSYSRDVVHRVRESGGSLVLRDVRTEGERLSHSMVTLGLRSVLCVPLFVHSRLVGAVYLDDTRRAETFGDSERTLLESFAELLASAIESSRGQARVRRDYEKLFDENLSLRRDASVRYRPHNIIGGSVALQRVMSVVERAAMTSSTVLITGENGTGKELIARMLHHAGSRTLKPFVAVNCGALTPTLLESELFGIAANVATGVQARPGRFVEAHGGTLFLDEIGEMPVQQQVALLRVLSASAVTPVGGATTPVDVRVIAATNRDLTKDIEDGRFRQDLWYRLNVIPVELPPLRDRRADIPALALHFVAGFAAQQDRAVPELSPALMAALMQSDWPGNVRELQNYIERLMAMSAGHVLRPEPLPHDLQKRARAQGRIDRGRTLRDMVSELERRQLQEALERHGGNQSHAARELGLTEQSLRYRLRRYALPATRHFRRTR